jgi:hypothetical protein
VSEVDAGFQQFFQADAQHNVSFGYKPLNLAAAIPRKTGLR